MVTSTRARRYGPDQSDHESCSRRPAKRRRLQASLLQNSSQACGPSVYDGISGILGLSHDSPIYDRTTNIPPTDHSQVTTRNAQTPLAELAPTRRLSSASPTSTPPSLCLSRWSTSEDSCRRQALSTELISTVPVLHIYPTSMCDYVDPPRTPPLNRADEEEHVIRVCERENMDIAKLRENTTTAPSEASANRDLGTCAYARVRSQSCTSHAKSSSGIPAPRDHLKVLGSSISPPSAPCSPPEFVYEDVMNPKFGEEARRAYALSRLRESFRRDKYGAEVADMWKRGSTPEEAREKWRATAAKQRAEAEEFSDSD